jgi:type IV pilus assembly protein PilF
MRMPRRPISLLTGLLATLLAACAVPQAPAPRTDWTTESDESLAHRRARLRLELAAAYYQQNQDAVALDEVKQALAHDAGHAAAWNLRGLIYLRQQEWALAGESFERALALAPSDADAAHNLGWLRCQQPQPKWAEAEQWFGQSLAQARAEPAAKTWTALGLCQQRAGRLEDARASLAKALALAPGQPRTLWPLAQVLYSQAQWQPSWEALAQLHAIEKPSAESLWLAVRVARKLDNAPWARQAEQQLRQQFGRSPQAQALDKGWFDE